MTQNEVCVGQRVCIDRCSCGGSHVGEVVEITEFHVLVCVSPLTATILAFKPEDLRPCEADDLVRDYQALQESGA